MAQRIGRIALEVFSLLVLLGTAVFLIAYWQRIPAQVPNHFDHAGQISGLIDKKLLIAMPILMALVFVSFFFCKTMRFRSLGKTVEIPAPPLMFPAMKLVILAGFAYLTVCSALARPVGAWFLPAYLVLLFLPIVVVSVIFWPKQ